MRLLSTTPSTVKTTNKTIPTAPVVEEKVTKVSTPIKSWLDRIKELLGFGTPKVSTKTHTSHKLSNNHNGGLLSHLSSTMYHA